MRSAITVNRNDIDLPLVGTDKFSASLFLMPGIFLLFAAYSIFLFFNFEKSIDKNLTLHFNSSNEGVTH